MDNLKLYASSGTKQQNIIDIILQFSNDIGIEFGLDKCQKVHLVRGEVDMQLGHEDEALIETMAEKDFYKHSLLNTCRIVRFFLDHQEEGGQLLLDLW